MTLERLSSFERYWKDNPPLHVMFASYAGFKSEETEKNIEKMTAEQKKQEAEDNCARLLASLTSNTPTSITGD